jgi:hypothetical protein
MFGRSSNEVLNELLALLAEYQNAVEEESRIKNERIGALENDVYKLKAKNAAIAHILTEED